jgi:hypothetical protein
MSDRFPVGDTLSALHAAAVADLGTVLDVDGGVRDVLIIHRRARLDRATAEALDVDAGLRAVVPPATDPRGTGAPPSAPLAGAATSGRRGRSAGRDAPADDNDAVAAIISAMDPRTRLAVRSRPVLDALAATHGLAVVRWCARDLIDDLAADRDVDRAAERARERIGTLDHDQALNRVLDRPLGRLDDPEIAREIERLRNTACAIDAALGRSRDPDLARDLANQFIRLLDAVAGQVRATARTQRTQLVAGVDPELTPGLHQALDHDLHADPSHGLAAAMRAAWRLDRARNDFTSADLRGVELTRYPLEGLLWSRATRWPSERWRGQALSDSTEIRPGLYELRPGTANVPTPSW